MPPDGTLTVGAVALAATLLWRAYSLGRSHGKLRAELTGFSTRINRTLEKLDKRMTGAERGLLLVSKNDPEGRRIAGFISGTGDDDKAQD